VCSTNGGMKSIGFGHYVALTHDLFFFFFVIYFFCVFGFFFCFFFFFLVFFFFLLSGFFFPFCELIVFGFVGFVQQSRPSSFSAGCEGHKRVRTMRCWPDPSKGKTTVHPNGGQRAAGSKKQIVNKSKRTLGSQLGRREMCLS